MKKSRFKNRKRIGLSLVALILIMLMTIGVTYSWIDDVKQIEIKTEAGGNDTPLKTGVDINAKVNVTKKNNTINLGDLIKDPDIKLNNGEGDLKYDDNGGTKNYDTNTINQKKGYFYESGDMHLSGCYSDGEHFYFAKSNGNYREGNKDDENVNYISFTVQVSSPDAATDFWFQSVPKITKAGSSTALDYARFAINVDGDNHVYSKTGSANTCNSTLTGTTSLNGVRKTSTYTYNHDDNTTEDYGKNSNVLFSIKEGSTSTVTFKIWLENGFTNTTAVDIDLRIISSWAYTRTIRIDDRTTTNSSKSWLDNHNATKYLVCPEVLKKLCKEKYNSEAVSYWDDISSQTGYEHAPFKTLTKNTTLSNEAGYDVYTVELPMVYNNEKMFIYRCSASGWNTGGHGSDPYDATKEPYSVACWNWWQTSIPNRYTTSKYTLYGGSHDNYAGYVVTDDSMKNTYLGYGTWGGVDEIKVNPNYHGVNWASYAANNNVYIRDYSDFSTSGETYVHSMCWNPPTSTTNPNKWTAVIPKSSTLIQFLYTQDSNVKGCYGYRSYNNTNPQVRPLLSNGTDRDCDYLFAFKNDHTFDSSGNVTGTNVNGIGYWQSNDYVYIIKNGSFANVTNFKSYFFYKYWYGNGYNNNELRTFENAAWSGTSMTKISDQYTDANGSYDVYKSQALDSTNGNNMFPDCRKSNYGSPNSDGAMAVDTTVIFSNNGSGQTGDLLVFPGCIWDPAANKWLGSLTDTGRSASGTGIVDSGDSGSTSSGTISGYTIDSGFTVQLNGVTYTVYTNSSGDTFKVRLPLASGDNWTTFQKSSLNYGLSASGQYYAVPRDSGLNIYLTKGVSNNISLRANSAGSYIVTFTYDNGNTNTIKIDSVVKES
jgi:hypothetical protein